MATKNPPARSDSGRTGQQRPWPAPHDGIVFDESVKGGAKTDFDDPAVSNPEPGYRDGTIS